MRQYETILVLDSTLDGEGIENEINRVTKMIEDNKGEVREVQRWGRRRLAFPIKKKTDGIYTYVRFEGNHDVLNEIDRRCALNESLLRYMTVVIEHPDAIKARPGFAQEGGEEDSRGPRARAAVEPGGRGDGKVTVDEDDDEEDRDDE